ncbi:unnamed protein product [Arabidopsis lyrata]|nr:unnamed protein product [Arabidopsis lyrata]
MAVIVATTTAEALPPDQPEPPDRLLSVGSPVLLFSTGSGLSSPASLPLLLARSFITVGAQFPGGSPFADWVGDLEARPCPTMAMTTSFRVACFFSDTSTSPPITFSQVYSPSSPSDSSTLESHQIVVDFEYADSYPISLCQCLIRWSSLSCVGGLDKELSSESGSIGLS